MPEQTKATLTWQGGLRFAAEGEKSGKSVLLDSPTQEDCAGPSPMELLIMGVAGCTAMDVVVILQKMRQPLIGLQVEILGDRAETNPKYYRALTIHYHLWGTGLDREKAERAVKLSQEIYCSALASLRPDCQVTSQIHVHENP